MIVLTISPGSTVRPTLSFVLIRKMAKTRDFIDFHMSGIPQPFSQNQDHGSVTLLLLILPPSLLSLSAYNYCSISVSQVDSHLKCYDAFYGRVKLFYCWFSTRRWFYFNVCLIIFGLNRIQIFPSLFLLFSVNTTVNRKIAHKCL